MQFFPLVLAAGSAMPHRLGECVATSISDIGSRLEGDPSSGSDVGYANGGSQISYDVVLQVAGWRRGDAVSMCLVSLPKGCPKGDTRGGFYKVTNLRTGTSWTEADSSHSCGGA
ncbi:MAG: hypothetical protein ACHP7N_03965 [Caulobacterales bacterium]